MAAPDSRAALALLLAVVACGGEPWPAPPPVSPDEFAAEHGNWREGRHSQLVAPGGAVSWIGLWDLSEGATAAGSDSALAIVLPVSHSPGLAGTFHRSARDVRFEPAPGAPVRLVDGAPVTRPFVMDGDRSDSATILALGSLRMRVHEEPGTDRLWLRVWDEAHPARETFTLPDAYPPDTAWRVAARFQRYGRPRGLPVADVTGGTIELESPGELIFRKDGREYRLLATGDSASSNFLVMLWDSTALTSTYQAGRYLRVPVPGEDGWTVIDFNRTYNAPCVFTAYSVCSLPPRENRLALAITAGEKRLR